LDVDNGSEMHCPGPTVHFTMVFNTFVMMTLFNEINARKIHGQRNIIAGLHTNPLFIGIWITTFVLQVSHLTSLTVFNEIHQYPLPSNIVTTRRGRAAFLLAQESGIGKWLST